MVRSYEVSKRSDYFKRIKEKEWKGRKREFSITGAAGEQLILQQELQT
jgi:hypothetical protein